MKTDLQFVTRNSTYRELKELLAKSKLTSFPLVDSKGEYLRGLSEFNTSVKREQCFDITTINFHQNSNELNVDESR